eukprot:1722827-Lingulodinium_polyedra.AAC.1
MVTNGPTRSGRHGPRLQMHAGPLHLLMHAGPLHSTTGSGPLVKYAARRPTAPNVPQYCYEDNNVPVGA